MPDPVQSVLDGRGTLTHEQRAAAWDAFSDATSPDDLSKRLDALGLPTDVKADLWDLKAGQSADGVQLSISSGPPTGRPGGFTSVGVPDKVAPESLAGERPSSSLGQQLWDAAKGVAASKIQRDIGALKGVGNTLLSTIELGARIHRGGQGSALATGAGSLREEYATPTNNEQTQGFVAEQILEAWVPGSKISKLGQAMTTKVVPNVARALGGGRAANIAGRAAAVVGRASLEGGGAAGMAAMQGQDPEVAANVAGGLTLAGAGLRGGRDATKWALGAATPAVKATGEFAERHGIPLSLAMETGSKAVERAQKTMEYVSVPAMYVAEKVGRARDRALARVGQTFADALGSATPRGKQGVGEVIQGETDQFITGGQQSLGQRLHPTRVTPQESGSGIDVGLGQTAEQYKAAAKTKYQAVEDFAEADAATRRTMAEAAGGPTFKDHNLDKRKMWKDVWRDAYASGYRGEPRDLRMLWEDRLQEAQSFLKERNAQNQGKVLLDFIAENGGIGNVEKELQGEADRLWEMSTAARSVRPKKGGGFRKQQFRDQGAVGGVTGVVKRGGLTAEQMVERLRNDPEISALWGITPEVRDTDLYALIDEAAEMANKVKPMGPGEVLAQQGVAPGRLWWEDAASHGVPLEDIAAAGGKEGVRAASGPGRGLLLSITDTKKRVRDLYELVASDIAPANRDADQGLHRLRQILELPDEVSALDLEDHISALKDTIREGTKSKTWRNRSAGLASVAVVAAERDMKNGLAAHPEALAALTEARRLTREQHRINRARQVIAPRSADARGAEIAPEGQSIYNQFATEGEANLERLRAVARSAPTEIPKLARAIFDDIVENGKWKLWERMGDQKKTILFGTPTQVATIDIFMGRARRLSELTKGRGGVLQPGELVEVLLAHPERLRETRRQAPDLGRAVLDDIFAKVAKKAETRGGQLAAVKTWDKLPEATRKLLVPDDTARGEIDQLFKLWQQHLEKAPQQSSRFSTNVVPAGLTGGAVGGTAAYGAAAVSALPWFFLGLAGTYGMGQLLHNPKARRLMLNLAKGGGATSAQTAAWVAQLNGIANGTPKDEKPGTPTVQGNIDLYNRPKVANRGGTSTVYSASFNIDGQEVLLPLADEGRILTEDEAIAKYRRTGKHLGKFKTPEAATAYAKQLHDDYEAGRYERRPVTPTAAATLGDPSRSRAGTAAR
jgi:hypothetical protein